LLKRARCVDIIEPTRHASRAVHWWDFVGDDDEGDELLARPELIDHRM
jgi:hypothetical protein